MWSRWSTSTVAREPRRVPGADLRNLRGCNGPLYHVVSEWHVQATSSEVLQILIDPLQLTEWWPAVYLPAVESLAARRR